jgi:subtilisin family serine protease
LSGPDLSATLGATGTCRWPPFHFSPEEGRRNDLTLLRVSMIMLFRSPAFRRLTFSLFAALLGCQVVEAVGASLDARPASRTYLVQLRVPGPSDAAAASTLGALEAGLGLRVRKVYRHALQGFAADLTPAQVRALRSNPRVGAIQEDRIVSLSPLSLQARVVSVAKVPRKRQVVPTGIQRCGAAQSATARINGIEDAMDVDVAVVDTGIDPKHPDLNLAGSVNFATGKAGDPNGHGTHVGGIIGARDNGIGVVGVAPGARLWSVRVLNKKGLGSWSDIIDGLDWIAARADQIEVANLSLSDDASADNPVIQAAFDGLVARGVTVVVAAGNADATGIKQASQTIPARYDSVIAVSALADSNGAAGHSAGTFKVKGRYFEFDESYADFSNYGPAVDLIAPGVAILSTYKNRKYAEISGTSQASPHVAGAAALYKLTHPTATPAQIRAHLIATGTAFDPYDAPDAYHEPALDASGL